MTAAVVLLLFLYECSEWPSHRVPLPSEAACRALARTLTSVDGVSLTTECRAAELADEPRQLTGCCVTGCYP